MKQTTYASLAWNNEGKVMRHEQQPVSIFIRAAPPGASRITNWNIQT
jgi:hypothetical protein